MSKDHFQAIFTKPNNTIKFADMPYLGVLVELGITYTGRGYKVLDLVVVIAAQHCIWYPEGPGGDVVIKYLLVGSKMVTK